MGIREHGRFHKAVVDRETIRDVAVKLRQASLVMSVRSSGCPLCSLRTSDCCIANLTHSIRNPKNMRAAA